MASPRPSIWSPAERRLAGDTTSCRRLVSVFDCRVFGNLAADRVCYLRDYNTQIHFAHRERRDNRHSCYWKDSFATLARESFQKKTAKLSFQKQRLLWRLHSQFSHHLTPSHSYLELHERGRLSQQFCHLSASRIAPLSKQSKHSLTYLLIQAPDSFVSHLRFVVEIAL